MVNKIEALEILFLAHSPHVVAITETWLNSNIESDCIVPPNYKLVRCDRTTRGGGVAICLRNDIDCVVLECDCDETVWCRISYYSRTFLFGVVYRTPNAPVEFLEGLNEFLCKYVNDTTKVIMTGDFNLPHVNWALLTAGGIDILNGEKIIDITFNHNLTQIVKEYTRITDQSQSTLDLVFITENISDYEISIVEGISDHKMILFTIPLPRQGHCRVARPLIVKDFTRADDTSIIDYLETSLETLDQLSITSTVDDLWNFFKTTTSFCINSFVPNKTKKTYRTNPWITREIIHLKRQIKRHRKGFKEHINALKIKLKTSLKQAKERFFSVTLHNFIKTAPQKFWRFLRGKREMIEQIVENDVVITDSAEMADRFNVFFQSVFSAHDVQNLDEAFHSDIETSTPEIEISQSGIFAKLLSLDTKKSTGPDKIPNEFLKRYAEWLSFYLKIIFDKSLQTESLPQDWLSARVVPVFKGGSRFTIENYRPISLTSVCCKVMEHVISKYIFTFLEERKTLYSHQHGFRNGLSTVTQLVETFHDFSLSVNNKEQIDVICIDFSKAFDRIPHKKLLFKLKKIGLCDKIVNWIEAYLSNRSQKVEINGNISPPLSVTSGVPQGSVLGPLLFLIYINDIATHIAEPVKLKLFADDCLLYSVINNTNDQLALNRNLENLRQWCEDWQMQINFRKSTYIHITNKKSVLKFCYNIGNVNLSVVNSFKYLGVVISHDLQWRTHIDNVYSSAYRSLCFLKRKLKHATSNAKITAYKTMIRPILEYASIVWSPNKKVDINRLEKIQRQAARFILNKYKRTDSVTEMLSQCGLQSLETRRRIARLKFLFALYNNHLNIEPELYLNETHKRSRRLNHNKTIQPYNSRIDVFKYSFFVQTIEDWNQLPDYVINSANMSQFESSLEKIFTQQ